MAKRTQLETPDGGDEPPQKKPCPSICESMQALDARLAELTQQKQALTQKVCASMQQGWRELRDSDYTKAYLLNTEYKESAWSCSLCTTDFTPLLLATPTESASEFLYHCEQCGAASCYKCTLRMLTLNARCDRSIGAQCPACRFYNCNLVNKSTVPRQPSLEEMPFPSGYSTVTSAKVKGEKLPTSYAVTSNETHETNARMRQEAYDILTGAVAGINQIAPMGPGSPRAVEPGPIGGGPFLMNLAATQHAIRMFRTVGPNAPPPLNLVDLDEEGPTATERAVIRRGRR